MADMTRRQAGAATLATLLLGACAGRSRQDARSEFRPERFQAWNNAAPPYRLYPGDTVEVVIHTADELNTEAVVGPDGRVNLALAGGVMVAGSTAPEAARTVAGAYARVLRDPIVEVRPTDFGSQRILVGGEVTTPGLYDMPSARIGVLEALMLAGGPTIRARRSEIVILRRADDGGLMMRTVDIRRALQSGGQADDVPLSRFDIVFAPRSGIAEVNDFIQQYVRNIVPLDAAISFALADALFN